MWIYALPGLSNVWMLLIKATSLLSLLQIPDIVLLADRLGAPNFLARVGLVHPDWRWIYYLVLFVFYILITFVSEKALCGADPLGRARHRGGGLNGRFLAPILTTCDCWPSRRCSTSISPSPRSRSASCFAVVLALRQGLAERLIVRACAAATSTPSAARRSSSSSSCSIRWCCRFNLSVWKPLGIDWLVLHPLFLGPAVLALNTTAYTAEIFYGALQTVPRGEIEAARAYGMSGLQQFRSVIWPNMHPHRLAGLHQRGGVPVPRHGAGLLHPAGDRRPEGPDEQGRRAVRARLQRLPALLGGGALFPRHLAGDLLSVQPRLQAAAAPPRGTGEARPRVRFAPEILRDRAPICGRARSIPKAFVS